MAITKAQLFNEKQIKAAEFAKAIAHPARIAILQILAKKMPVTVEILPKNCHWHSPRFHSISKPLNPPASSKARSKAFEPAIVLMRRIWPNSNL